MLYVPVHVALIEVKEKSRDNGISNNQRSIWQISAQVEAYLLRENYLESGGDLRTTLPFRMQARDILGSSIRSFDNDGLYPLIPFVRLTHLKGALDLRTRDNVSL